MTQAARIRITGYSTDMPKPFKRSVPGSARTVFETKPDRRAANHFHQAPRW